ncbi:MAG: PD-(D/E)XK nuclease family protein [Verrucomicrobia bacterium]|nr:PD-(D/E)XK nuclease family protein [Verrucomicrobiota bacterium]
MAARVWLGWDRPFLGRAVEWLLARRDELPGLLVVVPTAESGRRLREAMAEAAGAVLSPGIVTPGAFLKIETTVDQVAPDWAEQVAWVEVLEGVADWSAYAGLIPDGPGDGGDWAGGLARELVQLRRTLQENSLTLGAAARRLHATVEAERWEALGSLEDLVERKLGTWGFKSRSRLLAAGLVIPPGFAQIVLAGVLEMPPLLEQALLAWENASAGPGPPPPPDSDALPPPVADAERSIGDDGHSPPLQLLTVLIGAPADDVAGFSALGQPLAGWCERAMPWPAGAAGSVRVVADPRQQALEAMRVLGEEKSSSNEVALGSADAEVGEELARALTREGWPAFHPAAVPATAGLARWFKVWGEWLVDPTLAVMADLLTLPETGVFCGGRRAQHAQWLSEMRDRWMVLRAADLQRRIASARFRSEAERASAVAVLELAGSLEKWRARLLRDDFTGPLADLLVVLARTSPAAAEMATLMGDWMVQAAPVLGRVKRGVRFWLALMLDWVPVPAPLPPAGRVLDVQGWLELYYEPGRHLVLCGMNEGKVPARSGGEPWLSEAGRERLGLLTDTMRAARDAFLFNAMVAARHAGGRVDVICGKAGAGGESLLPSRLLLAAERTALPLRVTTLFREIEPPEAGLRWHADWQWIPRHLEPPKRISVTSLKDYLACPFRYYLKHVVGMQIPEPGRVEWNARDFGTVAHEVLERWGKDEEAREFDQSEALSDWFAAALERVVRECFGTRVPMAVRIQTESLRHRLAWLARIQASERAAGWQVVDVERKVEIPAGEVLLVAKIDRIDRHRESGELRVIDYKTGKVDGVEQAHRSKIIASTVLPAHLPLDSPAVYEELTNGKPVSYRWNNLQLPLYASALVRRNEAMPRLAYFTLGATAGEVAVLEWTGFGRADLRAAEACAEWVADHLARGVFGPPAEKVSYDDYRILAAGRTLREAFAFGVPRTEHCKHTAGDAQAGSVGAS